MMSKTLIQNDIARGAAPVLEEQRKTMSIISKERARRHKVVVEQQGEDDLEGRVVCSCNESNNKRRGNRDQE
jgi:hypothetical protein